VRAVIDKVVASADEAVADVRDGMTLIVGGWGGIGVPHALVAEVARRGPRELTLISNNCGTGIEGDVGLLFRSGLVRKVHASFTTHPNGRDFRDAFERGEVELELVPQGTLAERLRAGGTGLGGFLTPTAVGTALAEGKEVCEMDGQRYLLERPLCGDVALVRAQVGDRHGNLRFRGAARNFNPVMAMAGRVTIAEVEELVPLGAIDPDDVHVPGIFVQRVVAAVRS
jgi:3-oxoadipate CoA-transferase alpha subunit